MSENALMVLIKNVLIVLTQKKQKIQKKHNNNVIIVRIVIVLCVSQKLRRNMCRKMLKENAIMPLIRNVSIVSMLKAKISSIFLLMNLLSLTITTASIILKNKNAQIVLWACMMILRSKKNAKIMTHILKECVQSAFLLW